MIIGLTWFIKTLQINYSRLPSHSQIYNNVISQLQNKNLNQTYRKVVQKKSLITLQDRGFNILGLISAAFPLQIGNTGIIILLHALQK